MSEIAAFSDVLIGNEEDYQKSLGLEGPKNADEGRIDTDEYAAMCARALAKFPAAHYAAVTLRESHSADSNDWSAMLASRDGVFTSRRYAISDIVDRVGAGDSFSAGLIYGLIQYDKPQDALEYAVALSCLKHSISGDFALIEPGEVQKLMEATRREGSSGDDHRGQGRATRGADHKGGEGWPGRLRLDSRSPGLYPRKRPEDDDHFDRAGPLL